MKMLMHRKLIVLAVVGLLAALVVPAAFAGQPTIQRFPLDVHYVSSSCGFPVQIDVTGKIVDISYTDALGAFHDFQAGPEAKETVTNLVTGKTVTLTITGPGDGTFGADGSFTIVGTGLWSWDYPGSFDPYGPGMFLTKGRFVYSVSASGVATFTSTGVKVDLCAQLA
jgi:hypothetical protein